MNDFLKIYLQYRNLEEAMSKIFYVMGKSAVGKDTIYGKIKEKIPDLKSVVVYTTRPLRDGEIDGVSYHFITENEIQGITQKWKVIESRTYKTVLGNWIYLTVDDEKIDLSKHDYLMIGTLESYENIRNYFGKEKLVPLYLYVEDGIRLQRALNREKKQKQPNYQELCRRFLADDEDFKEVNMQRCGIEKKYENENMDICLEEILKDMNDYMKQS